MAYLIKKIVLKYAKDLTIAILATDIEATGARIQIGPQAEEILVKLSASGVPKLVFILPVVHEFHSVGPACVYG